MPAAPRVTTRTLLVLKFNEGIATARAEWVGDEAETLHRAELRGGVGLLRSAAERYAPHSSLARTCSSSRCSFQADVSYARRAMKRVLYLQRGRAAPGWATRQERMQTTPRTRQKSCAGLQPSDPTLQGLLRPPWLQRQCARSGATPCARHATKQQAVAEGAPSQRLQGGPQRP